MSNKNWTVSDIPNLAGKIAVVTGANSGIGYETAKALAEKNATVVMACRNLQKAQKAESEIRQSVSGAKLDIIQLDLADLASIKKFAESFRAKYSTLDFLINNAGIMTPPLTKTVDGFELQFGANHLGHFALTGHLLDVLLATPNARIVNVSGKVEGMGSGTINFDNLNAEQGYNPITAYFQSKLANLLFTRELNNRLSQNGGSVMATSAHPGWVVTGLQRGFVRFLSKVTAQKASMGALPTLKAAVDPGAQPNDYYGPSGFMEMRGYPTKVDTSKGAKDDAVAGRLWKASEELTDVCYLN